MQHVEVYKFGGASVRDAKGVENLYRVVSAMPGGPLVVVVSAMGKTTNALERAVNAHFEGEGHAQLAEIFTIHKQALAELAPEQHEARERAEKIERYAFTFLEQDNRADFDYTYDQIVAIGELLSTNIVQAHLARRGISCFWADARALVSTNNHYRSAEVRWADTEERITNWWKNRPADVAVVQGFIGGGEHGRMTTLGREGSDYSAAIFAHCLQAKCLTIWKDVAGVLNADPRHFNNTVLLPNISYHEAVELSYFGASVIHPKTLKPLENRNIPLRVKCFSAPHEPGTIINQNTSEDSRVPSYIFKPEQVLLSIASRDFSFIIESHLSELFAAFSAAGITINLMQNSALSFSACFDHDEKKLERLLSTIGERYTAKYNLHTELLTVRHANARIVAELEKGKEVLLRQQTRHTVRLLMRTAP